MKSPWHTSVASKRQPEAHPPMGGGLESKRMQITQEESSCSVADVFHRLVILLFEQLFDFYVALSA